MVPIKTTKNIIEPADFGEDSCGGLRPKQTRRDTFRGGFIRV